MFNDTANKQIMDRFDSNVICFMKYSTNNVLPDLNTAVSLRTIAYNNLVNAFPCKKEFFIRELSNL